MDFLLRIFLPAVCLLIATNVAAQSSNCELYFEDGSKAETLEYELIDLRSKNVNLLDNTSTSEVFYTFTANNVKSAVVSTESDSNTKDTDKYFTVSFEDNTLKLSVSSEFENIEETVQKKDVSFTIILECDVGSALRPVVTFKLVDTNNHEPTFDKSAYTFDLVPMPLPSNFDLTRLYQMTVSDIDVSSRGIDMSLDAKGAEYFTASGASVSGGKQYSVKLTTVKKLELSEPLSFVVTATDRGTEDDNSKQLTSVTLTIDPDVSESVYEPRFKQPLYTASIKQTGDEIIFQPEDIVLNGLGNGNINLSLGNPLNEFDFAAHIDCKPGAINNGESKVVCSLKNSPDSSEFLEQPYALITLKGQQSNFKEDYTIIHISLPGPQPATTTTSTTITATSPTPCPTTALPATTACPVCPTTVTPTECDCPTANVTIAPTTSCPTPSTASTEACSCPPFDPTTMCPTSTISGGGSSSTTPSSGTTCPSFDPTTMCPTSSSSGGGSSSTTPSSGSTCPAFDPTTMCPTTESGGKGTTTTTTVSSGSTEECHCSSFDPTTMCPPITICTTESPSVKPSTGTTGTTTTTTTTPAPHEKPEFTQSSYGVLIDSPIINVDILEPKLKKEDKSVVFSITADEETTNMVEINKETGVVRLVTYPSPGKHNYQLHAVIPGTELSDSASLTVTVIGGQMCDNSTFVFMTRYMVVKVPENDEYIIAPGLTNSQDAECIFSFETDISPKEKYFSVDEKTGNVTVKSLDREAEEFNNAAEPAIRLTLNATCGDQKSKRITGVSGLLTDSTGTSENVDFGETIPNLNSIMDIVVLVQDKNDNPPVFNPTSITVGYPTRKLADVLQPPSVATVQATDADIGENAVIRYSLKEDKKDNKYFWIHPNTGVIYPQQRDLGDNDDFEIVVSAEDRDGGDGANKAKKELTVTVQILEEKEVFEMVIPGYVVEDTASVIANISKTVGLDVRVLTSAVRTTESSSKSRHRRTVEEDGGGSSPTALRLVLYALEKDKPVDAKTVEKKLQDANVDWQLKQIDTTSANTSADDTSGYLAAVITLAVLIVLILAGAGVVAYIYIVRPRMDKTSDYNRFSRDSKEGTESNLSSVVPTIPPLTEDLLKKHDEVQPSNSLTALNDKLTENLYENTPIHYETDWVSVPVDATQHTEATEWSMAKATLPKETESPGTAETSSEYLLEPPIDVTQTRKRSLTLYGEEDVLGDSQPPNESSDFYDVPDSPDTEDKAARRKSVVTFNENVDTIEIERL